MQRWIRALLVLAAMSLIAGQARALRWETITSGWSGTRIVTADGRLWASTRGGLLRLDPVSERMALMNVDEGLFSNDIAVVAVDSDSVLWIGHSNAGLDRFDPASGRLLQTITDFHSDPRIFRINDIVAHDSSVYVATNVGVSRMTRMADDDLWVVRETYRGFGSWPRPAEITRLAAFEGRLYAGAEYGIAHAPLDTNLSDVTVWSNVDMNADLGVPSTVDTYINEFGTVGGGLVASVYGQNTFQLVGGTFQPRSLNIFAVLEAPGDSLYYATSSGLYRASGTFGGSQRLNDPGTSFKLFDLVACHGAVWGIVDYADDILGGVVRYAPGEGFRVYTPNTPGGNQVTALAVGRGGELWAGILGARLNGLYRLEDGVWTPYTSRNVEGVRFNRFNTITSIAFDEFGNVWAGSHGGGLHIVRPDAEGGPRVVHYDMDNSPLQSVSSDPQGNFVVVNGLAPGPDGGMWITNLFAADGSPLIYAPPEAYRGDTLDWDPYKWEKYGSSEGLVNTNLDLVVQSGASRALFIASTQPEPSYSLVRGLRTPGDASYTFDYYTRDQAGFKRVLEMTEDRERNLWVASDDGLFRVRDLTSTGLRFEAVTGANSSFVHSVAVDALNQVWVGTNQGVSVLGRDRFTWVHRFTTEQGAYPSPLVADEVVALAADEESGDVFLGTGVGLVRVTTPYRDFGGEGGDVTVAPQPFILTEGAGNIAQFTGASLTAGADVRIYTPSGRLIRHLNFSEAALEGWDGRDEDGELVASGVYLISVTGDDGQSRVGKVAVVRK